MTSVEKKEKKSINVPLLILCCTVLPKVLPPVMRRRLIKAKNLINKAVVERFTWHGSLVPGLSADPQFIDIDKTMRKYISTTT